MTDRQIFELYLHPRNEDGGIDLDEPAILDEADDEEEDTRTPYEADMEALESARSALHLTPAQFESLKAKIDAKYGRTPSAP